MKKLFILLAVSITLTQLYAQRCLDIKTTATLELVHIPASAAASFRDCHTKTNDNGSLRIGDYGDNYKTIDTFILQKSGEFTAAKMKNLQAPQVSSSQIDDAKQLAATVNSMTDEQKKAFAMQIAQQQMNNRSGASSIQDDAATSRLVLETQNLSARQLYDMNSEFRTRLLAIEQAAEQELAKITAPKNTCPLVGPNGFQEPECNCSNKLYQPFLKQKVAIAEKYNQQKLNLYNEYLPKVKATCAQIDANIAKLKMGDAVKTKNFKDMLAAAQGQAFALASEYAGTEQSIRKAGADEYLNLDNCNHNVYVTACNK